MLGVNGLLASLLLFTFPAAPATAHNQTATPSVSVEGEHLVDENGRPIQLRGVNRSGTEFACVQGIGLFEGPTDEEAVAAIGSWGANAVRIPLNEDCWLGAPGLHRAYSGTAYRDAIVDYADRLGGAGMVVILDLHWTGVDGDIAREQQPMARRDRSSEFWRSVASRVRDRRHVIFDAFNEPHDVTWECWRDGCGGYAGMQELVDAIRSVGAMQPIVVSGLDWGGDLRRWLEYRPHDPAGALVAGAHLYDFNRCVTELCWDAEVANVASHVPVVITEFGDTDCTGDFSGSLMGWADASGISYLAWAWNPWDCGSGPAVIRSFDGQPTAYGQTIREHFVARIPPMDRTVLMHGGEGVFPI